MATAKRLADSLRPASFRNAPFQVDATEMGVGRRTQANEYPQRDKPWVEDLGRAARELSFDAFVVGPDYVAQANKLIGALEEPGSGTLVHPWFGTLTVSIKDLARVAFSAELGQAHFTLSFIESGELAFPSASASTQAQSRQAADNVQTSAVGSFAKTFSVGGRPDFISDLASKSLTGMMNIIGGSGLPGFGGDSLGGFGVRIPGLDALGYGRGALSSLTSALALLNNPTALGWQIASFLGVSDLVSSGLGWAGLSRSLVSLSSVPGLATPPKPAALTPSGQQAYANATAVNALARQLLLVQAVGGSSLVGTSADTTPRLAHDDMMAVRDTLTAALDAESLTATDDVYQALQDARGAVWKDLTTRARDSARLTTITPAATAPALTLAYDYYEDASREADIVARNGIRHPGFVPPQPLKVLTR